MGWPIRPLAERIEEKLISCDRGYKTPCLVWTGYVVCRFVGLRGFYNLRDKSYATQNPFKRKEYR
jgi:hypothetical protein